MIEAGAGHLPPAPQPSMHEALRGPGAYFPEGAEQALAAVGPAARAVDFSKAPERRLLEEDKPDPEEVRARLWCQHGDSSGCSVCVGDFVYGIELVPRA